jgi:hypothetical protein
MKVNERVVRHRFEYQASEKFRKFVRLVRAWSPMFGGWCSAENEQQKIRELRELAMVAKTRRYCLLTDQVTILPKSNESTGWLESS